MGKRRKSHLPFLLLILIPTQCIFLPLNVLADYLALSWDPNHEPDLAGYRVYYGKSSGNYDQATNVGNVSSCSLSGLEPNRRYYLSLTAYDTSGNESDFSNEVSGVSKPGTSTPNPSDGQTDSEDWYAEWGCFIATAAYGSYLNPHVKILRDFRDELLTPNFLGRKSIQIYYQSSPRIANYIGKYGPLQFLTRQALLPLVGMSSLFNKFNKTRSSPTLLFLPLLLLLIFPAALRRYRRQPVNPPNALNVPNQINDPNVINDLNDLNAPNDPNHLTVPTYSP
jgi:hypothetical protein